MKVSRTILLSFFIIFFASHAMALSSQEQLNLKDRVQTAMDKIDQQSLVQNTENFIVSMYQQILQATPNDVEILTAELLLEGHGEEHPLNRSHFVEQLLVLKGKKDYLSWEDIEQNIKLIENLNLTSPPLVGVYALRPYRDPSAKAKKHLKPIRHTGTYKPYFGYLHAHSELSDGRGDAISAYKMAKHKAELDYFALTDHSELLHFWPWDKKYKKLKQVAHQFNEDGKFAALYGFEWSHPLLGHFNVVNTERFTSAILSPTMGLLMNWLSKKKGTFGRFNHPGRVNMKHWPYEFSKLKVYKQALKNVVGLEVWNKGDNIKEYLERKSFKAGHNFLDNANLNGWYLGAVGGQDNHDADWGLRNDYRVGVWSEGLTRQQIVDAYFGRRTFATEDKNAWADFRIDGAQMGSRLTPGRYKLILKFGDLNKEKTIRAKLVKRGKVIKEYSIDNSQSVHDQVRGEIEDYFYIISEQEDGDILISSPIWFVPSN